MTRQTGRVCVVGAGPAGLAMARALKAKGLAFDVYERHPGVGGIWNQTHSGSPVYDSAHFISSKGAQTSTFRGHPFPDSAAVYPSHSQVLKYLEAFAAAEDLTRHIRFSTAVERAEPAGTGWRVHAGGAAHDYAALICASGTLWDPITPDFPGAAGFTGTVRHSVTYRSAEEVKGKHVVVVGAGNSGVDIACEAARSAASVSLSLRRGYWFVPKFIAGQPTDIVLRGGGALPEWLHPPDAAALLSLLAGPPEAYGLPAPDHAPFASHPIMNSEVLHHLGHGRIKARSSIDRLEAGEVIYVDGLSEAADEIILATGYRASLPYLPAGTFDYRDGTRPHLWMRVFHPTQPGLYGLGFIETNSSVYRLFDLGAELIAGHIRAKLDGSSSFAALDASLATGVEPDLKGTTERISSPRHVGYIDSRAYQAALQSFLETQDSHGVR